MIFHTRIEHPLLSLTECLHTRHVVYELGGDLTHGIYDNSIGAFITDEVRLARVIIDPKALGRLDLHHVAILYAIVLAIPCSSFTHSYQRLMIY